MHRYLEVLFLIRQIFFIFIMGQFSIFVQSHLLEFFSILSIKHFKLLEGNTTISHLHRIITAPEHRSY